MSVTPVEKFLFITLSNIGDAIMTTPVMEALHALYPGARMDLVADARSAELFSACPYLSTVFLKHKRKGMRGLLRLLRELRRTRYQLVVDLRTDGLSYLLRARRRCTKWGAKALGTHAVERSFAVIRPLWSTPSIPPAVIWLHETDREYAKALKRRLPQGRLLALAPGANWAAKIWPGENFGALLQELRHEFEAVILLGGPRDAAATCALAAVSPLPVEDLAGRTTLRQAAALLEVADLFVGNDSGLGHMAAAVGVSSLTLFGPGEPERYHPWGPHAHWLVAPGRDLHKLNPAAVAAKVRQILSPAAGWEPSAHASTSML